MSDEEALLRAIYAEPDDDTARLVYADWLDEHGQPERAEFIRVQITLDERRGEPTDDEFRRLWDRQNELLNAHEKRWTAHLSEFDKATGEDTIVVEFVRGFPEVLHVGGAVPADFAILRLLPGLRRLEVGHSTLSPDVLRDIGSLQYLDAFTTEYTPFELSWLELLDPLPCWTHIRILEGLEEAEWEAFQERRISRVTQLAPEEQRLAAIRYLRALKWHNKTVRPGRLVKTARLSQERTTDAELRLLSYLPELEEIEIIEGRETVAGLQHLSGLPNLKKVWLGPTYCESIVPLMNCTTLEHLTYYGDGVPFSDESVVGLERLTNLRHLTLRPCGDGAGLGDATIRRTGMLRQLRTLDIDLVTLEEESSLAALLNLIKLEFLTLNGREYTGAELTQFLESLRQQ